MPDLYLVQYISGCRIILIIKKIDSMVPVKLRTQNRLRITAEKLLHDSLITGNARTYLTEHLISLRIGCRGLS